MVKCPTCGKNPAIMHTIYGITACKTCLERANGMTREIHNRRGMTAYERMKLGWYRSEKTWQENIRNRKIVKTPDGRKVTLLTNDRGEVRGRMPEPRDRS